MHISKNHFKIIKKFAFLPINVDLLAFFLLAQKKTLTVSKIIYTNALLTAQVSSSASNTLKKKRNKPKIYAHAVARKSDFSHTCKTVFFITKSKKSNLKLFFWSTMQVLLERKESHNKIFDMGDVHFISLRIS